jgi:pilus assembly protein CpaF
MTDRAVEPGTEKAASSDVQPEAADTEAQPSLSSRNSTWGSDGSGLHERIRQAGGDTLRDERPSTTALPTPVPTRGTVDPYSALKSRIHRACITDLGPVLFGFGRNDASEDLVEHVRALVIDYLEREPTPLARQERKNLIEAITDDILGYGPLEPFLKDDTVTEVMVNGFDEIYVERAGRITATAAAFVDDDHLRRVIDKIVSQVGRRIDEASPMVDARLPDGSRINAIIPPLSLDGPALTIRKFTSSAFSLEDLYTLGTVTPHVGRFLAACVGGRLNILISGGSGAGKTTLMNALSRGVGDDERIITVEDAAELKLQQRHVVRLESRPPNIEGRGEVRIRELVRNALRMRPDRIIVGEVRGAETLDMLQAMNTGHEGSLTTVHANSPRDALNRVEMLVLTSGVDIPIRALREQIAWAFDLIIHVARLVSGERRISHVTEVTGAEGDMIQLHDLFVARPPDEGEIGPATRLLSPLEWTGLRPHFLTKLAAHNIAVPPGVFSGARRTRK